MRISYSLAFVIYVSVEAVLLVLFAVAFGTPALIGLLLAGFLLGLLVMRIAGMSAFAALSDPKRRAASFGVTTADGQEEVVIGAQPTAADLQRTARQVGASSLLFVAGILLATPGILSDIAGLVLLLPPVRRRIATRVGRSMRMQPPGAARVTVVTTDETGWTASEWSNEPRVIRGEILPPQDH